MTKFNPYRGAAIFGSLPVSFRRAGKVAMRFCDSLNSVTLPVSFRRAGKITISQLNGAPKWPRASRNKVRNDSDIVLVDRGSRPASVF